MNDLELENLLNWLHQQRNNYLYLYLYQTTNTLDPLHRDYLARFHAYSDVISYLETSENQEEK